MRVGVCEQIHCHFHIDIVYIFGIVGLQRWMIAVIRDSNKCENLVLRIHCLRILTEHEQAEKRYSGKFQILLNTALFVQRSSVNCKCNIIYSLYITFQTVLVDAEAGMTELWTGDGVLPTSHVNKVRCHNFLKTQARVNQRFCNKLLREADRNA